jgi:hypothetical protein
MIKIEIQNEDKQNTKAGSGIQNAGRKEDLGGWRDYGKTLQVTE